MEQNQLNFSAPLLSTRRYSSPLRSSVDDHNNETVMDSRHSFPVSNQQPRTPDVDMGELLKPVSVPFRWEQTPGKAKGGNYESHINSTSPRLPPGRTVDSLPWYSGRKYGELNGFMSPNKFSGGELSGRRSPEKSMGELNRRGSPYHYSTKLSGGQPNGGLKHLTKLSSGTNSMFRMDSSGEGTNRTTTCFDSLSDDYDEDAAFSDAVDTFESFSINCSISGVSGSEYHRTKRTSRELPSDVHSRDFMINRFLPAAKAMTLEAATPQYESKKQIMVIEQPRQQFKDLVPTLKRPPPSDQNLALAVTPYTVQGISEESNEADEAGSFEGPRMVPVKACGFLPWICAKNSLKFLNPLPAIKVKTKNALSSAGKLVKDASPRRTLSKHVPCTDDRKPKANSAFNNCDLRFPKKIKPRPTSYSEELQARSGLSPYRNYRRSNNVSPLRSESPQSVHHRGLGLVGVPKRVDSSTDDRSRYFEKDLYKPEHRPSHHSSTRSSGSRSPLAEKILYVDSGEIARIPGWSSISSKPKKLVDNSDLVDVSKRANATENIMKARGYNGPRGPRAVGAIRGQQTNRTMKSESHKQKVGTDGSLNMNKELILIGDDQTSVQSPLAPPLPKSPTESWLSRNLASVSPRNSFTYANVGNNQYPYRNAKTPPAAASAAVTKWENIVKSSHMHFDHGLYSQELVTRVSHPSRTRN